MKKLLILVMAMGALMAQDIAGDYRVSALDVQYYDIARQDVDVNVQDIYNLGVEITLTTIHAGDLFYGTRSGPYNEAALSAAGINLNVNFNEDGSCSLAAGSYYPDVNEEDCVSSVQVLPITDDMIYSSSLDAISPVPTTNMIGLPSISARAGTNAGSLSLNEALVFDYFPWGAIGYGNQYSFGADGSITGAGIAPVSIPLAINPTDTGYPGWNANAPLPGIHGGWVSVGDLGASQILTSTVDPDLYAEWHAIDGIASESGLGDFIGQDEDGFDDDFDRTFGLPVLPEATYFTTNAGCDLGGALPYMANLGSTPIAGDVSAPLTAGVEAGCYGSVLAGAEAGVTGGCYATVVAGVVAACDGAGGVFNTVYGGCVAEAQGDEFAAGCGVAGVAYAVESACIAAGGPATAEEADAIGSPVTCGQLASSYQLACADDADPCQCAADAASSSEAASLCSIAGGIGLAGTPTCGEFAAGLSTEYLDEQAVAVVGSSCPDYGAATAAGLAGGYALGAEDTTGGYAAALAGLNDLAALSTGADCPTTAAGWAANCIASVGVATNVYVMDPSGDLATWSNFTTGNAVQFGGAVKGCVMADDNGNMIPDSMEACLGAGGTMDDCTASATAACTNGVATAYPSLLVDDSGYETTVLTDGVLSGRLVFNFAPTCIPEIEVRQVVIEAVALGDDGCAHNGDANESGGLDPVDVLDVVQMVGYILGNNTNLTETGFCNADINSDGGLDILDVVAVVQVILNGRTDSASAVEIIKSSEGVSFVADGSVGGIQMTISHGDDFSIEMTAKAMVADYRTEGNSTTLMVVNPESNELFVAEGNYTIETVVAANNGEYIDISVPSAFSVSNAYPNPFNPTTNLNINLDAASYVSVKVFNVMGQLIDTVTEGQMTVGTHAINWDASSVASGVYFINTEVGSSLSSQKVMLLK
jgi:hypothetical protein